MNFKQDLVKKTLIFFTSFGNPGEVAKSKQYYTLQ